MRITGLHLKAYGHFAGCSLHFGREPGLHLVYGHNEAGKSTTLRALSSVLFGYPHGVVDGFRHGAKDIALGIDLLAAGGRTLSFERRRRGRRVLTAADGSALDEAAIESFLGGVSQDVFEKVFALDHRRLREHAQALLADGGSLGFSLVEAGSGIAGLKSVLDRLGAERGELFRPSGSRPRLNQAINEFVRLRKEAKRLTVSPAEYRSHEQRIRETEAELNGVRERRKELESEIVRLQRIAKNLPLRAQHLALTRHIEALGDMPALPPEFAEQRVKAAADLNAARLDLAAALAAIEDLERRIAAITVDSDVLTRADDIQALAEKRPFVEKYESEIPRHEAERGELLARVAELMAGAELGGGPADLAGQLPSMLRRRAVQTLANVGKKLTAQRPIVQGNVASAARLLSKAQENVAQARKPRQVAELSRALAMANNLGPVTADIAKRTRALDRKAAALDQAIAGLGLPEPAAQAPATDPVARLRALALPAEKTEARYADALTAINHKIKKARDDVERLSAELKDTGERIVAMKTAGDIATEDDLKLAREAREQGWKLVRGLYIDRDAGVDAAGLAAAALRFAPDGRVAEAYEMRVHDADRAVDTLRARVKESTELAFLKRQAASIETKKAEAAETLARLDGERGALLSEWRALWPAGLITVQSPGEMADWMVRRRDVLAAADELEGERDAVRERMDQERQARQELAAAMAGFVTAPPDGSLEALREQARSLIAEEAEVKSRYENAETTVRTMSDQKAQTDEEAEKLEGRLQEWSVEWRKSLSDAGLPPELTIEMAEEALDVFSKLDGVKSKIDGLNHSIAAMRAERDSFGDAVAGIAAILPGAPAGTAAAVCRWLEQRLHMARRAEIDRKNLAEQLESRTADRERASDKLSRSSAVLDALCARAGCSSPDELPEIERKSADQQDSLQKRGQIETRVREDGDGRDFTALFAECDDVPADRIQANLVTLGTDRSEAETCFEKLMAERAALQAAFNNLLGQQQAADLVQQAEIAGAEIEEGVEAYVDLTVQETLLQAAIDVYRDRNQGPILGRARDLFIQLTDGAYSGLRADLGERGETILVVEDAARGSLELDALSDGTVDAVYLALRLAVVQEHNATREPLPFIADDLLLNLDNKRSVAALRTLADVARSNQVLLFTHHAHMVDLARDAVPAELLVEHNLSQRRLEGPNDGPGDGLPDAAE